MKIIGLFPLTGNGGIASWRKKYLATFPDEEYTLYPINLSPEERTENTTFINRVVSGLRALKRILSELESLIKSENIDVLHTTTSGNLGSYRDIKVAQICRKYRIKTIMHCRYGCITEDVTSKTLIGYLVRKAMTLYDQIWVLDTRSYNTLKSMPLLGEKVYLVPNSIEVSTPIDITPKTYERVAFVGNVLPTKGILELVKASLLTNVRLDIIGPISEHVESDIVSIAGNKIDDKIFIHGRLANSDAVEFMKGIDIVALPTYYPSEAFPISIIEAMSLSKLVISCPRAAIPDMLTDLDGKMCGILVAPQSVDAIVDAINWCQTHKNEADEMCTKAYEKVYVAYRKEIVYDLYRRNYNKLMEV